MSESDAALPPSPSEPDPAPSDPQAPLPPGESTAVVEPPLPVFRRAPEPVPHRALDRVRRGLALPFELLRDVARDSTLRSQFRRSVSTQLIVVGVLSVVLVSSALVGLDGALESGGTIERSGRGVNIELGDRPPPKPPARAPDEAAAPRPMEGTLAELWVFLAAVWGALKTADWVVAAFFREPNDALTHALSLHLGAMEEEAVVRPRIRFSFKWALGRLKRQFSGALLIALGGPVFFVASQLPGLGGVLRYALAAGWGLYWVTVLLAAKTKVAWAEPSTVDPWFLRGWPELEGLRGVGPLIRLYARLLRRVSRALFTPAAAAAHAPLELIGLLVVRALAGLPLVSIFLRSTLPVAAGRLIHSARAANQPSDHRSSVGGLA